MRLPVVFSAPFSRRDLLPLRQSPSLLPRTRPTVSAPCLQLPLSASCHPLHRGGFGRTLASVSQTNPSRKHTASRKVCLLREQSYKPRQRIIIYRAFKTSPLVLFLRPAIPKSYRLHHVRPKPCSPSVPLLQFLSFFPSPVSVAHPSVPRADLATSSLGFRLAPSFSLKLCTFPPLCQLLSFSSEVSHSRSSASSSPNGGS